LAAGTYTVTVTAGICPPQSYSFTVADCCPTITISHAIGKCNPDGTRNVTYTAVLSSASSTSPITAQMTGPCVPTSGTGTGSLTLTSSCALNTGTYTVTVTAGNCPPQSYTFTIEDCCPTVDFESVVCGDPECNGQGTRPVHLIAHITPHTGVQTTAQLIDTDSGATLATGTSSTPFTLTGNGTYTSGSHQVTVSFGAPLQCPDQTFDFCVPDCESSRCWWAHMAIITFGSALLSLLFLLVIQALATYLDGNYPVLGPALQNYVSLTPIVNSPNFNTAVWVLTAVSLVAFFLWLLCIRIFTIQIGYCCGSWCIFLVMLWQIPLMTGVVLLLVLSACFLLILISSLVLFLVAYLFFRLWQKKCCVGKCDSICYTYHALLIAITASSPIVVFIVKAALVSAPNWLQWLNLIVAIIIAGVMLSVSNNWKNCWQNC